VDWSDRSMHYSVRICLGWLLFNSGGFTKTCILTEHCFESSRYMMLAVDGVVNPSLPTSKPWTFHPSHVIGHVAPYSRECI